MRRALVHARASGRRSSFFTRPVLLTLIAITGCGSSADHDSAAPIVTDSAGVMVVDYAGDYAATSTRRWRADDEPLFTIGDSSLPLGVVIGPVFQSDGGFVVGNARFHEILLFNAAGELLVRSAGQGDGPGEFNHLTHLSVGPADSIVAYDARERRVLVFAPTGEFVRTVPMPDLEGIVSDVGITGVTYAGMLADGRMVVAIHQRTAGTGLVRDSLVVVTFSPASDRFDALGTFAHTWHHWGPHRIPGRDAPVAFPLPVPLSGQAAVATHGDSIYVATADRLSLTLLTPDGIRRITRGHQDPDRITDAHRDALFAQMPAAMRENPETELQRGLAGPATLPAFGRGPFMGRIGEAPSVVTDIGGVWLQPFSLSDSIDNWPRFDAAGVYEGVVVMPHGFRPTAVRGDIMLGVYRDSSDVEYVRAYRLGEES